MQLHLDVCSDYVMAEERPPGAVEDAAVQPAGEEIIQDDGIKQSDHSEMACSGSVNEDPSVSECVKYIYHTVEPSVVMTIFF